MNQHPKPQQQSHPSPTEEETQPHQQDDCQGCQKERAQNNKLIDFYQRLHKIKTKVSTIKPAILEHTSASKQEHAKLEKMGDRMTHAPNLVGEVKGIDEKEMGYQLTCALLEREIKMRRENQLLSRRIKEMKLANQLNEHSSPYGNAFYNKNRKNNVVKIDSEMQSQPQPLQMQYSKLYSSHLSNGSNSNSNGNGNGFRVKQSKSVFSDSLDNVVENGSFWGTHEISSPIRSERAREENSRYSIPFAYRDSSARHKDGSTYSSFEETGRTVFNSPQGQAQISPPVHEEKNKNYDNLNLWLYQYKVEEEPVFNGKTNNHLRKKK